VAVGSAVEVAVKVNRSALSIPEPLRIVASGVGVDVGRGDAVGVRVAVAVAVGVSVG